MAIVFSLFFWLFRWFLVVLTLGDSEGWRVRYLIAEKELQILRRTLNQSELRPRFTWADRVFFAGFHSLVRRFRDAFHLMRPTTVLAWYHDFIKLRWSHPSGPRGRRPLSSTVKNLILAIKKANLFFGLTRIRGELAKLDIEVGRSTIQRVLHEFRTDGQLQPTGSWSSFLRSHWESLLSCDFFTVDGALGQRWYVFFMVELKTRLVVQWGITLNPAITFLRQMWLQFTENHPGRWHVIHDHGPELMYFPYHEYGITDHPTCIASPNLNAYAERFVRSIRRECLDHFIILGERQLRHVIRRYLDYYNHQRPHQGLGNQIPEGPPPQGKGEVRSRPLVFGLVRDFYRSA